MYAYEISLLAAVNACVLVCSLWAICCMLIGQRRGADFLPFCRVLWQSDFIAPLALASGLLSLVVAGVLIP